MLDIAYVCEIKICISEKILDDVIDDISNVDFSDFIFAIDNYDLFSILYNTHGGV